MYKIYNRLIICILTFVFASSVYGASITFSFANIQITGTSPQFFEFDVMAHADVAGTRLGDAQVYINYDTTGFGKSIAANGKITVTKGSLLTGDYDIVSVVDNTPSRVAITTSYNSPSDPGSANLLPTSPTQYVHVKIEIADPSQTSGLSFEQSLMAGQQFESDNSTPYDPVLVGDGVDSPLPVELSSFTATVVDGQVMLNWTTHTETNNLGFDVERSIDETKFQKIGFVKGKGTTIIPQEYMFKDGHLAPGTYYYRLKQVDLEGTFEYSEVITVTVNAPKEFALAQNYPNPFNPETMIRYDLPASTHVVLRIYNILGKEVKTLVDADQSAGVKMAIWDGTNNVGEPVGSGVYYYKLVASDFSKTLKLMLLK